MVRRKKKIVVEPFDDIKIIGVCSSLEDYKLAWHINKSLNINLVKFSDIINEEGKEYSFYLYVGGENCNTFNLVNIVGSQGRWMNLPLAANYLIVIRNFIIEENLAVILDKIEHIEGVQATYLINSSKNSKINVLLEDIEIHELGILNSQ